MCLHIYFKNARKKSKRLLQAAINKGKEYAMQTAMFWQLNLFVMLKMGHTLFSWNFKLSSLEVNLTESSGRHCISSKYNCTFESNCRFESLGENGSSVGSQRICCFLAPEYVECGNLRGSGSHQSKWLFTMNHYY